MVYSASKWLKSHHAKHIQHSPERGGIHQRWVQPIEGNKNLVIALKTKLPPIASPSSPGAGSSKWLRMLYGLRLRAGRKLGKGFATVFRFATAVYLSQTLQNP